ncbi:tRNA-uridine aminocarboxypropyltransferase [Marinobacterium weihaiense]|uniref:tRNA-uridine aminocarboxypropyltransferase n=1 Tax=Marinobacterium weihaiense TaxID=2851016 RepID=A0ABS6MEB4_9GAMM|nr:DTW domain-containing protein [Marinobacterium weihaiense]MBV0934647.1 DTW domain-containing protein [Marinobacterium weihaiense]
MKVENPHRKPFVARGSGVVRCEDCRLPQEVCICEWRFTVPAKCQFWLLTHRYELYKPTNTGRLIMDSIKHTRLFEWSRTEPCEQLLAALADECYAPCLVFPAGEDYRERMIEDPANDPRMPDARIPVFIILDGTWRQARRMFRHSRYLQHLPVIEPRTDRLSRYQLRRSTIDHHLCTAEVAVALLEQVGDQAAADHLEGYFERFNSRYIATRRRWARRELE